MPELPEVEAARRAVEEHCAGRRIHRAMVADDPKVVEGIPPSDFEVALVGKTIVSALRKGKNLWLRLDTPPFPSFQFGMTGAIHIKGVQVTKYKRSVVPEEDEWPSKYSKVFLQLDDGLELSFTDKRRFARVRLLQNPELTPPISELGPDAFLEPMKLNEFFESLSTKKISIKGLLLDQSYIAGIGNWIADEVLYQAGIHPLQVAGTLTKDKCEKLLKCIKEVVHYAVEVDADCDRFPLEWLFHFRWGKKPGKVNGKKIEFISAGGRTTAYVPELQKLDHSKSEEDSSTRSKDLSLTSRASRKREKESSERKENKGLDTKGEDITRKVQRASRVSKEEGFSSKNSSLMVRVSRKRKESSGSKKGKGLDINGEDLTRKAKRASKASKEEEESSSKNSSLTARVSRKREKESSERKQGKGLDNEREDLTRKVQRVRKASKEEEEMKLDTEKEGTKLKIAAEGSKVYRRKKKTEK